MGCRLLKGQLPFRSNSHTGLQYQAPRDVECTEIESQAPWVVERKGSEVCADGERTPSEQNLAGLRGAGGLLSFGGIIGGVDSLLLRVTPNCRVSATTTLPTISLCDEHTRSRPNNCTEGFSDIEHFIHFDSPHTLEFASQHMHELASGVSSRT